MSDGKGALDGWVARHAHVIEWGGGGYAYVLTQADVDAFDGIEGE